MDETSIVSNLHLIYMVVSVYVFSIRRLGKRKILGLGYYGISSLSKFTFKDDTFTLYLQVYIICYVYWLVSFPISSTEVVGRQ